MHLKACVHAPDCSIRAVAAQALNFTGRAVTTKSITFLQSGFSENLNQFGRASGAGGGVCGIKISFRADFSP
jgi:hypothetical protein